MAPCTERPLRKLRSSPIRTRITLGSTTFLPPPRVIGRGARSAAAAVAAKPCGAKCQSMYLVHTKPPRRASSLFKIDDCARLISAAFHASPVQLTIATLAFLRRQHPPSRRHPFPLERALAYGLGMNPCQHYAREFFNTLPSTTRAVVGVLGCSGAAAELLHQ